MLTSNREREISSSSKKKIKESFFLISDKIENCIQNGQLEEANYLLLQLKPEHEVQFRIREHLRGLTQEFSGNLDKAYSTYLLAMEKFGENVNLIRDLSSACYQLDLVAKWRFYRMKLKKNLQENIASLSFRSQASCTIYTGKYEELDGDLYAALNIYEECFHSLRETFSEDSHWHRRQYLVVLSQIVRLKAQFNHMTTIGFYYSELISLNRSDYPKYLMVEVQHSLMLAELSLIGPQHAWARAKSILDDETVLEADRRLIYFDFLEEMMIRGQNITDEMQQYQSLNKRGDAFENEIYHLAFHSEQNLKDLSELSDLASFVSWSCYLRILILYFGKITNHTVADELRNKINLILSFLSNEAKAFWLNRMKPYLGSEDLIIGFSRENRTVTFQNKEVDLSRKKGMLLVLEAMVETSEKSVDEMIRLLWNSDYSPENYHRLRMTVHRLNQILFDLTSISKIFEVSADRLSIKPSVCLESSNF